MAASEGQVDAVKTLLRFENTLVTARDKEGWTAAHFATQLGNIQLLEVLYSRGASFKPTARDGE